MALAVGILCKNALQTRHLPLTDLQRIPTDLQRIRARREWLRIRARADRGRNPLLRNPARGADLPQSYPGASGQGGSGLRAAQWGSLVHNGLRDNTLGELSPAAQRPKRDKGEPPEAPGSIAPPPSRPGWVE